MWKTLDGIRKGCDITIFEDTTIMSRTQEF